MPELPNVIGGETITSSFTNQVKNRTLMRYLNVNERDTLIPAPVLGDVAFIEQWVQLSGVQWWSAITVYGRGGPNAAPGWWPVWQGNIDYVPDTGGTFTGNVKLQFAEPQILFTAETGGTFWRMIVADDGNLRFQWRLNEGDAWTTSETWTAA